MIYINNAECGEIFSKQPLFNRTGRGFLAAHPSISAIILNGTGETKNVFEQNFSATCSKWNCKIIPLPSTSNSLSKSFEEKLRLWKVVKEIVERKF